MGVKITELPDGVLPLAGSEQMEMIQGDESVKIPASALITSVRLGSVTQTPAGSTPTVVNSGSERNIVLDFTFPASPTGSNTAKLLSSSFTVDPGQTRPVLLGALMGAGIFYMVKLTVTSTQYLFDAVITCGGAEIYRGEGLTGSSSDMFPFFVIGTGDLVLEIKNYTTAALQLEALVAVTDVVLAL